MIPKLFCTIWASIQSGQRILFAVDNRIERILSQRKKEAFVVKRSRKYSSQKESSKARYHIHIYSPISSRSISDSDRCNFLLFLLVTKNNGQYYHTRSVLTCCRGTGPRNIININE